MSHLSKPEKACFSFRTYCFRKKNCIDYADMAELADAPDLGSGGVPRAGSIPVIRSMQGKKQKHFLLLFIYFADNYGGSTGNYDTLSVY